MPTVITVRTTHEQIIINNVRRIVTCMWRLGCAHLTDCESPLRINRELCQVNAKLYNINQTEKKNNST